MGDGDNIASFNLLLFKVMVPTTEQISSEIKPFPLGQVVLQILKILDLVAFFLPSPEVHLNFI